MMFNDGMTLRQVRDVLRSVVLNGEGMNCPCCTQRVDIYERTLNSGMARSLITMYRAAGKEWQHIPTTVGGRSREEAKLRYWGLVEQRGDEVEGKKDSGWWRVTPKGENFIHGRITVPKMARVFNKRLLSLVGSSWSIRDALGHDFNFQELMYGEI
jgi:hypothetical protein